MNAAEIAKRKNQLRAAIPADVSRDVRSVLEVAISDLGIRESFRNGGAEIDHLIRGYGRYWWHLDKGAGLETVKQRGYVLESEASKGGAWCAMAVSNWIRTGLGLPYWDLAGYAVQLEGHPFRCFLGGPTQIETWAKSRGAWHTDLTHVPSGAVFTMALAGSGSDAGASNGRHTGFVVLDTGNEVVTIEGNVANGCVSRHLPKASIRGYAVWTTTTQPTESTS